MVNRKDKDGKDIMGPDGTTPLQKKVPDLEKTAKA